MGQSNTFANPIVNLTGSIPAASQGLFADIPATGLDGQWYLAEDTLILWRWDALTSAWVIALSGSGTPYDFNYPFGPVNLITANTTLSNTRNVYFVKNLIAAPITVTLPVVGIVTGKVYTIKRTYDSAQTFVQVTAAAGNIDGLNFYTMDMPGAMAQFMWDGTTWQSITYAFTINGGLNRQVLINTAGSTTIGVTPPVNVILVDSTAGPIIIVLQVTNNFTGHVYNIKRINGANPVTLTCTVGGRIDGVASPAIAIGLNQDIQVYFGGSSNFYIL